MKMKKTIIVVTALIGIMACTKELPETEVPVDGQSDVVLYASFDSEKETKATTEDGLNFSIGKTESIGVYVEHSMSGSATNVKFDAETPGDDGWVPFKMDPSEPYTKLGTLLGDVSTKIYAYGPYSAIDSSLSGEGDISGKNGGSSEAGSGWDGFHYVSLTENQTQESATDVKSVANYYTYAAVPTNPTVTEDGSSTRLGFYGIYALVKFKITNETAEDITVNKVKLTVDDADLTGNFKINLKQSPKFSNTEFALTPVSGKTKNYVEVSLKTPAVVAANGTVELYAVVNSSNFTHATVDVYAKTSTGECFFTKEVTISEGTGTLPRASRATFNVSLNDNNVFPLTIEGQIARGGVVEVKEAVDVINLNGLNIAQNVVVKINAPVGKMILYGNNMTAKAAAPNIKIEIAKDVAYPDFDFGYSAQSTVRNLTLVGDPESTALYAGSMQMWDGENITIDGINFAEGGFINSCGKTATGVKNLVIQNCKAINGKRNGAFLTLWRTEGLKIYNNTVKSTNFGDGSGVSYNQNQDVFNLQYLKGNVLIEKNNIVGSLNHHAIWIAESSDATVSINENTVTNAYEDAVKVDHAVKNVSVTNNILDAGVNGVRFDNFNGTAATLLVTGNTISTKGNVLIDDDKNPPTRETGYGIYLKNKNNIATNVELTAKNNIVGANGIANDWLFAKATTLTMTGDYATPFEFNASSLSSYLEVGGTVTVDFPVKTIDFKGLNILQDLTLVLKYKVDEIKLGGNVDSNDILIQIEKEVDYPKFTFNADAKNITIQGDLASSKTMSNSLVFAKASNVTIKDVKFSHNAVADNDYTIEIIDVEASDIKILGCQAEGLGQSFAKIDGDKISNVTIDGCTLVSMDGARDADIKTYEQDVLYINGAKNVTVKGNNFTNSIDHHAIYVDGGSDITITGNTVTNAHEDAVKVDHATSNVSIINNTLDATRNGIRFDNFTTNASGIVITGNTISTDAETPESYAIHFKKASPAVNVDATIKDNKVGTVKKGQYCRVVDKITLSGEYEKPFTIVEGGRYITYDNAFGLNNEAALKWFADQVNTYGNTFAGQTVKLLSDVTLTSNWTPVGKAADNAQKFQGTFDGNNKTISGLIVNQVAGQHAAGFFGALNGTVKNLVIEGAKISNLSSPTTAEGGTTNGTAVVAGSIYNTGYIQGVTVKNSTVSGNRYVGAIAGYAYGSIDKCTVENTTVTSTPDNLYNNSYDNGDKAAAIAGLVGEGKWNITNNTVKDVTVHAYRDMGGIVGNASAGITVTGNTVNGLTLEQDYTILTGIQTTVAPIIGRYSGEGGASSVTENSNTSTGVTIKTIANGISVNNTAKTAEISNANGMVWANNNLFATSGYSYMLTKNIDMAEVQNWSSNIAGYTGLKLDGNNKTVSNWTTSEKALLLPHTQGPVEVKNITFKNCVVTGSITTEDGDANGLIAGFIDAGTGTVVLENCHIDGGSVIKGKYAGGFTGYISRQNVTYKNCSVENMTIEGGGSVGAFVGHDIAGLATIESATVKNCHIKGAAVNKSGIIVGTIQQETSISISSISGNTVFDVENSDAVYGRIVGGCLIMGNEGIVNTSYDNGDITYDGLKTALSKGCTTIRLTEGTYIVPEAKNKTLSFIGIGKAENTTLKVQENDTDKGSLALDGSTVTFENIKIKSTDVKDQYVGYIRCAGTYKKCIIDGELTLTGNSLFDNCTFTVANGIEMYNVWTYGTNSTFKECTFNGNGKAVLVYNENANTDDTVTFENCTFNDNESLNLTKAAIEAAANDATVKHKLIISNCTYTGFSVTQKKDPDLNGTNLGTNLWGNKNMMTAENLAVIIDGQEVY